MEVPIAWFVTGESRIVHGKPVIYAPYLALRPEAELIQDAVVASLLEVEPRARTIRNGVSSR